jgi:hypothetical protein
MGDVRFLRLRHGVWLTMLLTCSPACSKSEASSSTTTENVTAQGACGDRELPDCPTQGYMKANLQLPLISNDFPRLAKSLEHVAAAAPDGYAEWAAIARRGADAARKHDLASVKASCGACHEQHRSRFKAELRTKVIF